MAERIEDYAIVGDLQTVGLIGKSGSVDWLCFPPLRLRRGVQRPASVHRRHGRWLIAPASGGHATEWRYREDTLILESEWQTDTGARGRVIDFMPQRETKPDIVRIVECLEGFVEMRTELVMRFDYGFDCSLGATHRRKKTIVAIAGPDGLVLRTPVLLDPEAMTHTAEFTVHKGNRVPFRAHLVPVGRAGAGNRWMQRRRSPRPSRSGSTGWPTAAMTAPYKPRGAPVIDRAEGAHVRANRCDRGRTDDVVAGADRRSAQLGLPLLMAARRNVHPLRG